MLFWAPDSRLNPVGKLKPPSWETQSEEQRARPWITLHDNVMDRPSWCLHLLEGSSQRGRHAAHVTPPYPRPLRYPQLGHGLGPELVGVLYPSKPGFLLLPYLLRSPVDPTRFLKRGHRQIQYFWLSWAFPLLTALRIADSLTDQVSVKITHFFFSPRSQNNFPYKVEV